MKSLEKLIAGYAPIVYGFSEDGDVEQALLDGMSRLRAGGARRIIFVSKDGTTSRFPERIAIEAASQGLLQNVMTWEDLVQR